MELTEQAQAEELSKRFTAFTEDVTAAGRRVLADHGLELPADGDLPALEQALEDLYPSVVMAGDETARKRLFYIKVSAGSLVEANKSVYTIRKALTRGTEIEPSTLAAAGQHLNRVEECLAAIADA